MKKVFALVLCLVLALAACSFAESPSLFETFKGYEWSFSSGVGGWSTDLRIQPDGSFSGEYHDSEMGETGEGYPDGTIYGCTFSGKMSVAEQIDEKTWKIRIDELALDEGQVPEAIEDGVRYVTSDLYGLSAGDEMILYAPGTPVSVLSEEMQLWAHVMDQETPPTALEDWFLMSEKNNSGFVGYPMAAMPNPWTDTTAEELKKTAGLAFGVPDGAQNVVYRYLAGQKLAEMQFTIDGDEFCARILPSAEAADISGMYFTWENEEAVTIGGCPGTLGQAQDGSAQVALCRWFDQGNGLQYSLSVRTPELNGLDLTAVAEQVYAAKN